MSSLLRRSLGKSINNEIRCCSTKETTDETSKVEKTDVVSPKVWRHGEELRSDSRNRDKSTQETSIVKHDDPSSWERQGAPGTKEVLQ